MPELKTGTPATQTILVCRLRQKQLRRGNSLKAGEIELENSSLNGIEIETDMHPLQHLNLVVTDARGTVLSEGHYGDMFSPRGRIDTFCLTPGEKYTHNVFLFENVPEEKQVAGTYTIRAVYEYKGLKAISEPLLVELPQID